MNLDSWRIGLLIFWGRTKFAVGASLLAGILIPLVSRGQFDLLYSFNIAIKTGGALTVLNLLILKLSVSEVQRALEREGVDWKLLLFSPEDKKQFFHRLGYNQFYLKSLADLK